MKKKKNRISDQVIEELWRIRHPQGCDDRSFKAFKKIITQQLKKSRLIRKAGLNIRMPPRKISFELSTARNQNLINKEEQKLLQKTIVGFFGLSVGSHAASTWMMLSRAEAVKIIDPDTITPSNLNRLRFGWESVGRLKTEVVKEQLLRINPFANIFCLNNVEKKDKIKKFFDSFPKIMLVVDEIDSMEGKIMLRRFAKKRKIPLISAADVGDNVILDIERYDQEAQPEFFLNRLPGIKKVDFSQLSIQERKKLIIKLVGFEKNSEKMLDSLLAIGKTIVTWPQLGSTATISGGIVATVIKKIVLGEKVKSGRYYFSLDDLLVADFNSRKRVQARKRKIRQIRKWLL